MIAETSYILHATSFFLHTQRVCMKLPFAQAIYSSPKKQYTTNNLKPQIRLLCGLYLFASLVSGVLWTRTTIQAIFMALKYVLELDGYNKFLQLPYT